MRAPAGEPHDTKRVIADVGTLRAISDPLRLRILEALEEPRSVTEVAEVLGVPRTRLYYHVKVLESHDLIGVVETRIVSGILERRYRTTAASYAISPEISPALIASSGMVASVFDEVRREFESSLAGTAPVQPDIEAGDRGTLRRSAANLTASEYREFRRRMNELIDEFEERAKTGPRPDGRGQRLFLAIYPEPDTPQEGEA